MTMHALAMTLSMRRCGFLSSHHIASHPQHRVPGCALCRARRPTHSRTSRKLKSVFKTQIEYNVTFDPSTASLHYQRGRAQKGASVRPRASPHCTRNSRLITRLARGERLVSRNEWRTRRDTRTHTTHSKRTVDYRVKNEVLCLFRIPSRFLLELGALAILYASRACSRRTHCPGDARVLITTHN